MRDNAWISAKLENIWKKYFVDVELANDVFVSFGRNSKTRLGSIKNGRGQKQKNTYITITGYFKDPTIPEYMVEAVLAHELVHYCHGFFSPLPQLFRHPHKHKIVDNELTKRGLQDILRLQKKWLKDNWKEYVKNHR